MTTTNLGMTLPTVGADSDTWGNELNANLQLIDDFAGTQATLSSASATGVSLSNGTNANITSVSLAAGTWDVSGTIQFSPTGATITSLQAGISTTSATFAAISAGGRSQLSASGIDGASANYLATPTYRLVLGSTTTVYLIASQNFSAGSISGSGYIGARRVI